MGGDYHKKALGLCVAFTAGTACAVPSWAESAADGLEAEPTTQMGKGDVNASERESGHTAISRSRLQWMDGYSAYLQDGREVLRFIPQRTGRVIESMVIRSAAADEVGEVVVNADGSVASTLSDRGKHEVVAGLQDLEADLHESRRAGLLSGHPANVVAFGCGSVAAVCVIAVVAQLAAHLLSPAAATWLAGVNRRCLVSVIGFLACAALIYWLRKSSPDETSESGADASDMQALPALCDVEKALAVTDRLQSSPRRTVTISDSFLTEDKTCYQVDLHNPDGLPVFPIVTVRPPTGHTGLRLCAYFALSPAARAEVGTPLLCGSDTSVSRGPVPGDEAGELHLEGCCVEGLEIPYLQLSGLPPSTKALYIHVDRSARNSPLGSELDYIIEVQP